MSHKLIVFDCDGTLIDSQAIICAAMDEAFQAVGLSPPSREETLSIVGLSLPVAIHRLALESPVETLVEQYKAAFTRLRADPQMQEPLYPGIAELLASLRERDDVFLSVATGKSRRGLKAIIEHHEWHGVFNSLHTADDGPSKPHPAMLHAALDEASVPARDAVMIGDTVFDIEMARAANVRGVGVAWGYHPTSALVKAGADRVHNHAHDLRDDMMKWLSDE
ncbi:MAG: HAD-IA family hydrolase [Pseudomonadota bacterium]